MIYWVCQLSIKWIEPFSVEHGNSLAYMLVLCVCFCVTLVYRG